MLVEAHSNGVHALCAGMKALPDTKQTFSHTQALWRFLANTETGPEVLAEPLLAVATAAVREDCRRYALVAHDWSRLNFRRHEGKRDRRQMTHRFDVGYELQSGLLLDDVGGAPVVTVVQNLTTSRGTWQTYTGRCARVTPHLDELSQRIRWLQAQGFAKPLVHIVDREANSVAHLRDWSAAGAYWLIRAKEGSRVRYHGTDRRLSQVVPPLAFTPARAFDYHGRPVTQWIGEAPVALARHAKPARRDRHGQRVARVPGPPLTARLVVSELRAATGKCLARWCLLANLPEAVTADDLALWYYWRWRIESYFKLLKQAGHHLESWEQESGLAILKRSLLAAAACATVWRLARAQGAWAETVRTFLVRLSGRQMKRSRPITAPALLDGLFKLLAMMETLEHYSLDELRQFARFVREGATA